MPRSWKAAARAIFSSALSAPGRERRVEIHHAVGVITVRRKIAAQLGRVRFERAIERIEAFEQHPYAGRCAVIQVRMSFITASLPMSFSGSWK
jgi:hypothetical protein